MFSNVGMNPYGPGGTIVTSQAQPPTTPGTDARSTARGEAASSGAGAETVERVDPPKQAAPAADLPQGSRQDIPGDPAAGSGRLAGFGSRFTPLPGPISDGQNPIDGVADTGPAGPPPAFRRSLLDAQRAETIAPDPAPATISAPEPPDRAAPQAERTAGDKAVADAALPPSVHTAKTADEADDPLIATIRRLIDEGLPPSVPPSAEARAEAEFNGLRRMAMPYDTATVDVSR